MPKASQQLVLNNGQISYSSTITSYHVYLNINIFHQRASKLDTVFESQSVLCVQSKRKRKHSLSVYINSIEGQWKRTYNAQRKRPVWVFIMFGFGHLTRATFGKWLKTELSVLIGMRVLVCVLNVFFSLGCFFLGVSRFFCRLFSLSGFDHADDDGKGESFCEIVLV